MVRVSGREMVRLMGWGGMGRTKIDEVFAAGVFEVVGCYDGDVAGVTGVEVSEDSSDKGFGRTHPAWKSKVRLEEGATYAVNRPCPEMM